jgi:mRNA-degrading endonuclease toxin of MazEF toxin-antitoxin module
MVIYFKDGYDHAMTEQIRAMSEQRAGRQLGAVSCETLAAISRYPHLFIV